MKKVQLMGILNCTPDSFFDGGHFFHPEQAILHGHRLAREGADLIDIGGESTQPGAQSISIEEEIKRVLPVIKNLRSLPIPLSIDTRQPEVAEKAILEGVRFINDVTGLENPKMRIIAAQSQVPVCIMHMKGNPQTMQNNPTYSHGIIEELLDWFQRRIELLLWDGIREENIILDPGIGFGKTVEDNLKILRNLSKFKIFGYPLLIGLSRKSFMSKILDKPTTELLSTTLALNTMSVLEGVEMIRVHDVKEHRDVIDILSEFKNGLFPYSGSSA